MMRSTTPVVPHLRLSASRQSDRIGRLNSHPVSDDGRIDRGSPVGPQPVDPGLRADVPLANGFAMNASWSDLQTAIHDSLGDAPRGTHSKSVPRGNGRAGRASAPGGGTGGHSFPREGPRPSQRRDRSAPQRRRRKSPPPFFSVASTGTAWPSSPKALALNRIRRSAGADRGAPTTIGTPSFTAFR